MKVIANIDYTDFKLHKHLVKGTNLIEEYKEANIELDEERIEELLAGNKSSNFIAFIEVQTEEEKVETAIEKHTDVETAVKPRRRVNKERRSEDGQ